MSMGLFLCFMALKDLLSPVCVCVHNAVSVCVCAFAYISLRCMSVLQSHL